MVLRIGFNPPGPPHRVTNLRMHTTHSNTQYKNESKHSEMGATYVWQGDHHVGHWPTFLVYFVSSMIVEFMQTFNILSHVEF